MSKSKKKVIRTNPKLWESVKKKVTRGSKGGKPGQWSARKAQLSVAEYKKKGGGYAKNSAKRRNTSLSKWTRQKWGTKSGKNSVVCKKATGERYLPKKARNALTDKEYKRTSRKKRKDTKKGVQYSRQPRKISRKTGKYTRTYKMRNKTKSRKPKKKSRKPKKKSRKPKKKSRKWSIKRKRNINCKHPRGFSERQYCNRQTRGGKYKFAESKNKIALKSIKKSDRTNKKYKATFTIHKNGKKKEKTTYFGYPSQKDPKNDYTRHKDKNRRNKYIWRHMKDTRTGDPTRAGYLSLYVLWNKPSLKASITDYKKRLGKYNRTGTFPLDITGYKKPKNAKTKIQSPLKNRRYR
jgi:hypothetical protein